MTTPGRMRHACTVATFVAAFLILPLSAIGAEARSGAIITAENITAAEITDVGIVTVDGADVYAVDVTLDAAAEIRLALIEATGLEIAVLAEGAYEAGTHRLTFDPATVGEGMFLFALTTGDAAPVMAECACTN